MSSTNKVDISRALSMSLDDYARESGMYVSSFIKPNNNNIHQKNTKFDRKDDDMDEDEEDYLLEINTNDDNCLMKDIKIEDETEATENNNNTFDLRTLINGQKIDANPVNNNLSNIPKANSQQWRLLHPNNKNRPPGMPPLIQKNAELTVYNVNTRKNVANSNYTADCDNTYRNNNGNRNYNNNNGNKRNRNNNWNRPYNNNNYNKNQIRNNFNNKNNHKRNQRNNNNMNQAMYPQYFQNNNQQFPMIDGTIPNDLTIKIDSLISKNSSVSMFTNNSEKSIPPLMSIPQPIPITLNSFGNLPQNDLINNININKSTSLVPINNSGNLELSQLSLIASTLLDTLRKGILPEEKPKYDMKLQKEIHSIQRKPMIYKCPSGEVISSDGPGLDLGLRPSTTGISLNQRFA